MPHTNAYGGQSPLVRKLDQSCADPRPTLLFALGDLMSFAYYSAAYVQQCAIVEAIIADAGRRLSSADVREVLVERIHARAVESSVDRELLSSIRLAIALSPYAADEPELFDSFMVAQSRDVETRLPALWQKIRVCRDRLLPLPVIVSCENYLDTALRLRRELVEHYFALDPLVIRGDVTIDLERFEDGVLSLPVHDAYEGLPLKMMEIYTLLASLGDCSVLKLDDDTGIASGVVLDENGVRSLFSTGDYLGKPVQNILHDRLWHHGKCTRPVPLIYGKPVKAPWARGALYYLSAHALRTVARHYLRFPGSIEGEMYEDKAVGDILFDNNIQLVPTVLEPSLGFVTTIVHR
jgi:hypothetical protein